MIFLNTREELLDFIKEKKIVCEIGVFKGEFSKILLEKLKPDELHLIDIFDGEMCSGDKNGDNIVWTNLDKEYSLLTETYKNNKNVLLHKGYSEKILNNFIDQYFDLIYIDGDHSYEGIKKDLEISYSKIKNNGFICGHDYVSPRFEGVVKAVNEFCEEKKLKIDYLTKDGCPTFCIVKKH